MIDWNTIKHFKPEEFFMPDKMFSPLIGELDLMREKEGIAFKVTASNKQTGHSINSWHYVGKAVDGYFIDKNGNRLSLFDHFLIVIKYRFTGIGLYSEGFIHLDMRPDILRTFWIRNNGNYLNFNASNFKQIINLEAV